MRDTFETLSVISGTLLSTGVHYKMKINQAFDIFKDIYLNISTGPSICPTVGKEGQTVQLFIAWSGRRLEALDSG